MIKWIRYSGDDGEIIEFCCSKLKLIYGPLLTYDIDSKKYVIKVDRWTRFQDPYTSKYVEKKVEGVQDLVEIEYCPFCGDRIHE